jgi:iron complex transport system ATP-binding protein
MDSTLMLELLDVSYRYPDMPRGRWALAGISHVVRAGEFHAVLGPNGSGKTTLLRIAFGTVTPEQGGATILGRLSAHWPRQELARVVAVVPQREDNLFPQRVRETVHLGRYPHLPRWGREGVGDRAAVERALVACDVQHLSERWLWTLSGGEYQRVRIARALAQEPRLLILDEPGVSLDLRHEMELFELVRSLVDRAGLTVVMITHHLNLAARFADRVVLLHEGRVVAAGLPRDVLTADRVQGVFAWPVTVESFDGRPQVVPLRQSLRPPEAP